MAKRKRLNKRVVILLTCLGVTLALGVAGFAIFRQHYTPDYYAARGAELLEKGQYNDALTAYRNAVKYCDNPVQRTQYLIDMGDAMNAWRHGDPTVAQNQVLFNQLYSNARGAYEEARRLDASNLTALRRLADSELERNVNTRNPDWADYIELADQIVKLDPNDTDMMYRRARAKATILAKREETKADFEALVQKAPEKEEYWIAYASFLDAGISNAEAEAVFEQSLKINPNSVLLRLAYADMLKRSQDRKKQEFSKSLINDAIGLKTKGLSGLLALADYCRMNNDSDRAKSVLGEAIELFPDDERPYIQRAQVMRMKGGEFAQVDADNAKALALIRAGMDKNSKLKSTDPENRLGYFQEQLRTVRWLQADEWLDRMQANASLKPTLLPQVQEALDEINSLGRQEVPVASYLAGRLAYQEPKDNDSLIEAESRLRTVVDGRLLPSQAYLRACQILADIYMQEGQIGEVGEMLDRASRLAPDNAWLELTQATLMIQVHRYDEARLRLNGFLTNERFRKQPADIERANALLQGLRVLSGQSDRLPTELRGSTDAQLSNMLLVRARQLWAEGQETAALGLAQDLARYHSWNIQASGQFIKWLNDTGVPENKDLAATILQELSKNQLRNDSLAVRQFWMKLSDNPTQLQEKWASEEKDEFMRELALGRIKRMQGQKEEALKHLRLAEAKNPKDARLVPELFSCCVELKDFDQASKYADLAAELNLDGTNGRMFKGNLATAQKQYDKTVEHYTEAINIRPRLSSLHSLLGDAYLADKKLDKAREEYQQAIKLNPGDVQALLGQVNVCLQQESPDLPEAVKQAYTFAWDNPRVASLKLKLDEERLTELSPIIRHRERLAKDYPDDADNLAFLAGLYERTNRPKEAEAIYTRLADAADSTPQRVFAYAKFLSRNNRLTEAISRMDQYTQKAQDKLQANLLLGDLYLSGGMADKAKETYDKAAAMDAKDTRPYLRLAGYYQQAGKGPEALAQMKQYLALAGEKTTSAERQQYIRMLSNAKLYDQAIQAIDQSTPEQFSVLQRLVLKGQIALDQQQYQQAKDLFSGAVEGEPVPALMGRAEAWRQLGSLDQCIADLETVRGKNGAPPLASVQLAELYATYRNEYSNARMILVGVLNDNPRDRVAVQTLISLAIKAADMPTAGEWIAKGIDAFPGDKFFLRNSAELKRTQKLYPQAIADMQAVVKLDDKDTGAQVALAQLYIEGGQPAEAAKQIDLLRQNKDLAAVASALSGQLLAPTAPDQADKEFAQALKVATDEQLNFVLQCVSLAYGPKQDLDKLKAWANIRSEGKDWHYYYQLGSMALSRSLTDQAIQSLEQADQLSASSPDTAGRSAVTRQLGLAYYYLKRYDDALRLYDRTLDLTKGEVQTLNNKAWLLAVDMKRPADAVAPAKAAYEIAPARVEIVDTYGYVLFLSGDYANAATILEKGVNLGSTPEMLYHLALTYKKLNRLQEYKDLSRKAWDAVQKNPKHPNFLEIKDNWEQAK